MHSEQLLCVQEITMADDVEEEETSALKQHHQQSQVAGQREMQPWQARLAGHAQAIQQLDKDSLCRLSDPCQHPSKRSRSCPPDSFGAAPHQPADSTDAVHAADSSNDDPSDCIDDAMSGQASDASSAGQTGQVVQSGVDLHQRPPPDALPMPEGAALCHLATRTVSSIPPAVTMLAAQQPDSLDMTQPNLTPASQRYKLAGTDVATAPVRSLPCTGLLRPAAELDPDLECDRLAGARPTCQSSSLNPRDEQTAQDQTGQSQQHQQRQQQQEQQQQQQQQQPAIGQQGSVSIGLGKGKAAKWKQRAGVRDNGFGENEHPMLPPNGVGARQGDKPCLQMRCSLRLVTAHSCLPRVCCLVCLLSRLCCLYLSYVSHSRLHTEQCTCT